MKIAQVAPLYEAVPPRLYGGTERVVAHLTDALVALGHEVTLFASAEAQTRARLVPVRDQAIRLDPAPLKSDVAAHHGFPPEHYTFHLRSEGYLAFLGRISPEKRPDRAIEIARRAGKRLKAGNRTVYYVVKWALFGGMAVAIFCI